MTKRILVITPWKRRWEMGNSAGIADDHYFVVGLRERGFEVHFLCPRDGDRDPSNEPYTVHEFPNVLEATDRLPSLLKRPLWVILFTVFAVYYGAQVAKRFPPSVVMGHTQLSSFAVGILAARLHVPSIIKLFGVVDLDRTDWSRFQYLRKNLEQVLAFKVRHDAWVVLDDGTGGDVAARRHGVPPERVHLLPNGVNTEWSRLPPEVDTWGRYGIPPHVLVVLYLARITAWKRPDLFIRLAPRVLERAHHPVLFALAGDGPLLSHCEELVTSLGLESHIRFLGPVPHHDVPGLLRITSVFASTNERSNKSVPTCEAMVCGVPVVAFDVGDTRTVVRDGETGRLVKDGDLDEFAGAVASLLDDETTREQMGRHAQAFAEENFTGWPARIEMEARIIGALLERHRGAAG